MFANDIFQLGRHLAQGLLHLHLGTGDCISRNDLALRHGTYQAHHLLRHSNSGCAAELFFDFVGDLDSERKGGRAEQHVTPWHRDLILHWSQRHANRAEPTNIANAGRLRGLWETSAERLPHHGLQVLWLKTLTGTREADLEGSLDLDLLRPQPLVFELRDQRTLGEEPLHPGWWGLPQEHALQARHRVSRLALDLGHVPQGDLWSLDLGFWWHSNHDRRPPGQQRHTDEGHNAEGEQPVPLRHAPTPNAAGSRPSAASRQRPGWPSS